MKNFRKRYKCIPYSCLHVPHRPHGYESWLPQRSSREGLYILRIS